MSKKSNELWKSDCNHNFTYHAQKDEYTELQCTICDKIQNSLKKFICPKCGDGGEPPDESFDSIDGGITNFNYVCLKCDGGGEIPYDEQ